ncbi:ABC transporter permease [soil metagenome]
MGTLLQDLRYGIRMLLKSPGFTLVAVLALALGIGANTAIFTVINAVLLRPLPLPQSERLMEVGRGFPDDLSFVGAVDDPRFLFWRERSQAFEAMSAHLPVGVNLSGGTDPEFVPGFSVSVDFFRVLGVSPAIGRSFTAEEDRAGGERVVVLGDGLWRRRFGAVAEVIGKTISLNGESYTVVGVMPPDFRFTFPADVFVPLRPGPGSGNSGYNFNVLARLKAGVTREQALAEMKLIGERLRAEAPELMRKTETVNIVPYRDSLTAPSRSLLWILFGAVSFVLLIACANVANLQLTRSAARQKEMAVRLALGAGWQRIVRQLLTEAVLLALAGGAVGLLLAVWGTDLLTSFIPDNLIPRVDEISFDWRVFGFTLAAAVFTGLVSGLAPAVQATRVDVNHSLKETAGRGTAGAGRNWLRSALVVTEVALALVLLVGAMLLVRTFSKMHEVEPGFDPHNVLTFRVKPSGQRYETTAQLADFYRRATERIGVLPGVQNVAVTNQLPLEGQYNLPLEFADQLGQIETVQFRLITPDYFRVMKIGLKRGREFAEADNEAAPNVAIVNETFARRYLSNADPEGRRILVGRTLGAPNPLHIVGVVGDTKQSNLSSPAPPAVFVPASQVQAGLWGFLRRSMTMRFVIRTASDPLRLSAAVKREMLGVDSTLPVTNIRLMDEVLSRSVAQQRFNMLLVGIFAGLGLVLAVVGIYGVMSYAVAQRTNEIGIRMALGARGGDVLKLVVGQGMKLTLIGVAIGLLAAFALTRLMKSLLFGVSATDPVTFAAIALLLAVVALLACYIPARRATKVDPMVALRYE